MSDFKVNRAGLQELLMSDGFSDAVVDVAERIAGNLDPSLDVVVDPHTTDRRAASVTIRHPKAKAMEVKHGVLTRAANAEGFEVHAPGPKA